MTVRSEYLAGVDAEASGYEVRRAGEIESPSAGPARLVKQPALDDILSTSDADSELLSCCGS